MDTPSRLRVARSCTPCSSRILTFISATVLFGLSAASVHAEGFSDADALFYGQVRQVGGAQTTLLQSGELEITFANQNDSANTVTLSTALRPTGQGDSKPYSYALRVPLRYLPNARQKSDFLSISAQEVDFRIQGITINGRSATLPDGSLEFYGLSFASRGSQHRLDLIVEGDSTDSDGDGLPNWWETLHGLDPNDPGDADGDLDSDGWSNGEEFVRGSNPATSNTEPQLETAEILVPESGEAGLLVHVLDSDSSAAEINIAFPGSMGGGFEIRIDGEAMDGGDDVGTFSLADFQSGRLTIAHTDRAMRELALSISWDDGGEVASGQVLVRVVTPSMEDGSDASLWLDGNDLADDGTAIGNWHDRSGNDSHAMQPLADHQPVVADRSVDFAASGTAHLFFNDGAVPTGDHTVLASYRPADSADATQTLMSTNRGFLQLAATDQAISYPGAPHYQIDGLAVRGFQNASGVTSISIFRREADLLQNIFGLSYDGENVASAAIDPVLPTLGVRRPAIPGGTDPVEEPFAGRLHELLVFPTALPEQKLRDVHDYLHSKWGGAVIWDFSAELKDVALVCGGPKEHIVRGGHGDDQLGGGSGDDTLSGGPGDDVLTGGGGADHFVFGGVDTGRDMITDFDLDADIIDLSALFWGRTGDARQFLEVRLDTNFSTPIPTLDSVLVVQRPDGSEQEIVLSDTVIGAAQLIQLVVEGRIRMGGLSIPTNVQLALASGGPSGVLREDLNQPFTIEVTRGGEGVAAALDVPLGYFEDALSADLVLKGAAESEGQRAVATFARGETTKTLTFHPIPDLEAEGAETWQVAVLPHYRYTVGGEPAEQIIEDIPNVWLEVAQANAVTDVSQPARVMIHRNGQAAQGLSVDLEFGGTAQEGVHFGELPGSITIPAGQTSVEMQIVARAEGVANGPKVVLLVLASRDRYQLGNPHEAVLYAAATTAEANGAGFNRWLTASSGGEISSLAELLDHDPESLGRHIRAYALGSESGQDIGSSQIALRIVDGRPEILAPGIANVADIRWGLQVSAKFDQWTDAGDTFVEVPDATGLKLVGPPVAAGEKQNYYRINLTLDPGQLTGPRITALTDATRFGISGSASWKPDPASGELRASGGVAGQTNRIIAEVSGPATVGFEMEVGGGGADDSLVFYIDGVRIAETDGESVRVQEELTGSGPHLLMWEFKQGTGQAVIRDLPR